MLERRNNVLTLRQNPLKIYQKPHNFQPPNLYVKNSLISLVYPFILAVFKMRKVDVGGREEHKEDLSIRLGQVVEDAMR